MIFKKKNPSPWFITLGLIVNIKKKKEIRPNDFYKKLLFLCMWRIWENSTHRIKKNERSLFVETIKYFGGFFRIRRKDYYLALENNGKNPLQNFENILLLLGRERFVCSIETTHPSLFKK